MSDRFERSDRSDRGDRGERGSQERGGFQRGRRFFTPPVHNCDCSDIDYKNAELLRRYVSEAGKIRPRRQTGLCAKCQRKLAREVKRARHLALLPFAGDNLR